MLLALANFAAAENKNGAYLLRMAREAWNGTSCVLLQDTGSFHYEFSDGDDTRVFEGDLSPLQLSGIQANMHSLFGISQSQIEEPLVHNSHDLLDIRFLRDGEVKELWFDSGESQQPYRPRLKPLLRWMDGLRSLPHRELPEEAGKRNCLPHRDLVLKKREEVAPHPPLAPAPEAGLRIAPAQSSKAPVAPSPVPPLFRFELLKKASSVAAELRCTLVASDGHYRLEYREQKDGDKKIINRVVSSQITAPELKRLQEILDARPLATIRHHEPPGGLQLNISGAVLELLIHRTTGVQDLILTDSRYRNNFFYGGDADISRAGELVQFVKEHMEINATPARRVSELNGCSELP